MYEILDRYVYTIILKINNMLKITMVNNKLNQIFLRQFFIIKHN